MKWWRGCVLWNCAVRRFSFLISWSADDGEWELTAESDKNWKKIHTSCSHTSQALLCDIHKYTNEIISVWERTPDRGYDLVVSVSLFSTLVVH